MKIGGTVGRRTVGHSCTAAPMVDDEEVWTRRLAEESEGSESSPVVDVDELQALSQQMYCNRIQ